MKPITIFSLFFLFSFHSFSQNCIDYIILKIDNHAKTDTIYCKLLSEDDESIIIDNGHAITTLKKSLIETVKYCAREMTPYEVYKFQGLDAVTADMFNNQNTAGAFLRKAARNTYLGAGLAAVGTGIILTGAFWVKGDPGKIACYITGGVTAATSVFFLIRAWNQMYRAGKLLDLTAQSALYLNANQEGVALSIKF
ncbi:MAG: hypothetical protein LBU83_05395 [Bacteroidales bacterium]|jgi:hypothetical protein|nr:hypothetical protein [Bacteroidales bacterium]